MAVVSLAVVPTSAGRPRPSSLFAPRVSSPPSLALCKTSLRRLSLVHSRPRASPSGSDPARPSDDESLPEEGAPEPPADQINAASSSASTSDSPSVDANAAREFESARGQRAQLQESLAVLSRSLALLSSTLDQVSSAVQILSAALGAAQPQSKSSAESLVVRDSREAEAWDSAPGSVDPPEPWDSAPGSVDPPEPWDSSPGSDGGGAPGHGGLESSREEDRVPPHLVEQNRRKHKLAYKLQQSFVQARIKGLGKPFQVAIDEFAEACMDAHAFGIGLKELQLQLVLQDGSLTGAFGIRNQRWSDDPILNEESRIRSLWIRLVYATLAQLHPTETWDEEEDPIDLFVKQVLQMAFEKGYDLERIKLEQSFAGPVFDSGAVKTMRENQYLILLTLQKAKSKYN